ncbi:MAG: hypothetical protein HY902_12605, partial [Deltaproteobacteria bacterium]|nr:hypothetical protein [Deltaproteobacteria bacterium]
RPEDLRPLARAILQRLSRQHGRNLRLSPQAEARMRGHSWPGNIRELEAVLTRAALLEEHSELQLSSIRGVALAPTLPARGDWPTRDENERRYLLEVLAHTEGRIEGPRGAAKLLGMMPSTLRSRCQRLGVSLPSARQARGMP